MSDKITGKNLSYDTNIPPFLRALQAQAAGNGGPDEILSKRRRAGKKRSDSEEAEDAPLVVDDEGNVVDVRVDKDGGVEADALKKDGEEEGEGKDIKEEKIAGIGASKKRKAGKVVGGDAQEDAIVNKSVTKDNKNGDDDEGARKKPAKKKGKKIKLSFDPE
ncbi:hypothetical protein BDP81DRAFT_54883 [Colletotrichum phormii]|uniref:DUF4604 domain-containing protein n=1 Tax=Colletotrichum phormii TaxID=359342 RepID=A0AAI9ZMX1_9PEZI|nr:uncharacterized protein BDP81DRAFT_54883 [Colletotrichum phormii]KAK1634925.1 hypothetical protein BDP81DRAFT_54883 [Colletotrichum phormii]